LVVALGAGAVAMARGLVSDPSSGDGGSITVTTSAKVIGKHGHYTITVAGQLPAEGIIYLLWTDARKIKHPCSGLATEESFVQLGFGGSLYQGESPAGPFSEVKANLTGKPHLEYQFCGYTRFVGTQGDTELGAGVKVKVK
jgi:hypothetical protein